MNFEILKRRKSIHDFLQSRDSTRIYATMHVGQLHTTSSTKTSFTQQCNVKKDATMLNRQGPGLMTLEENAIIKPQQKA